MLDTCPVCRNVNESGATSCLRCGVTFAAIPCVSGASAPSSGTASPVRREQDSSVGQPQVPRRRLLVTLVAIGACVAITAAAIAWRQSGAEAHRDKKAWVTARSSNTTADYRDYLTGGTLGAPSEDATIAINLRLAAAVSRLKSRTNNGNREAVEGFATLAVSARDAGATALPIYFVRDVRLSNAEVLGLARQAGASRYASIEHALSPAALGSYEAGVVVKIAVEMRYLGFDELPLTHATGPVDQPAIRISYSIRPDGGLYQTVSPNGDDAAGRSATVFAGMIVRARFEFVVPRSQPLFAFDAEARPSNKLRFSSDPYPAMGTVGFETISLKFTGLFNPTPS